MNRFSGYDRPLTLDQSRAAATGSDTSRVTRFDPRHEREKERNSVIFEVE